jgi:hypothetical protein
VGVAVGVGVGDADGAEVGITTADHDDGATGLIKFPIPGIQDFICTLCKVKTRNPQTRSRPLRPSL